MESDDRRQPQCLHRQMVSIRARRALHTPPYVEPFNSAPSLVPHTEDQEDDCKRQVATIQKALRILPGKMIIDGEHWPPIFTPENVRSAKAMKPRADDVFICTYPKCGTTWIQHIVHQLLGKTEYEAAVDDDDNVSQPSSSSAEGHAMCFVSPMIERMGAAYSDTIKTPRILKSHFTYGNIPKGGNAKYIYCVRNPKDCLTSYFHHNRNFKIYNFEHGHFDDFFELFMKGEVGFGDYFDHLNSWLEAVDKAEEKILFLKYEDMVADLRSAVVKIADFLGGKAADLIKDEEKLGRIVEDSSLASMKKNQQRWFPNKQLHRGEFIRKGGSRDWKNQFTMEQSRQMDLRFRHLCAGTRAINWWHSEMAWNDEQLITRPPICLEANGSELSSCATSVTSGFYSASPLSFSSSPIDFTTRLRQLSLNPEQDGCYSPLVEGPLDRERVDSLQFPFDG